MQETTKSKRRRKRSYLLKEKAFVGKEIDIGYGNDILRKRWFKGITSIEPFDIQDGDAQYINKYKNENSYNFVFSSNCLEDMNDPIESLKNWFTIFKKDGYLVCLQFLMRICMNREFSPQNGILITSGLLLFPGKILAC